jgi:hypothetical protein
MVNGELVKPQKATILFVTLQCLDLLTTLMAFSRDGVELNPVIRSLMPYTGALMAVVMSKLILVSLVFLLAKRRRILYFGNLLYGCIVAWNLAIFLALRWA